MNEEEKYKKKGPDVVRKFYRKEYRTPQTHGKRYNEVETLQKVTDRINADGHWKITSADKKSAESEKFTSVSWRRHYRVTTD